MAELTTDPITEKQLLEDPSLEELFRGELLAVAIFSNPRTSAKQREYTTELFRMAFKKDVRIQGGASKLIRHYQKLPSSVDLFTYQDTSGEATIVYEHAGMTLKGKRNPTKEIFVKDGLTAETATNNRLDWFSMEQVARRGPDALLGTTLGELFEDGKRVSNVELFLRLGYHIEKIPGDRLYEWHRPDAKFYTYKITSSADNGYYIGRHRATSPLLEAMLKDGYMGSGGAKFQNWVNHVGTATLRKEVLGVYDTWGQSVAAEAKLIGENYNTDKNCKNSKPGGTGLSGFFPVHELKECPLHGLVAHSGPNCKTCVAQGSYSTRECSVHGTSRYKGDNCQKCSSQKSIRDGYCPIHGETKHMGSTCKKCVGEKTNSQRDCEIHGRTTFQGDKCSRCTVIANHSLKRCSVHGETDHNGNSCSKCLAQNSYSIKECAIHGETIHQGDSCKTCAAEKSVGLKNCSVHGETKHIGDHCKRCMAKGSQRLLDCPVHGLTIHQNKACATCVSEKSFSTRSCSVHGETLHKGNKCTNCTALKGVSMKICSVHGETKHMGNHCKKCMAAKVWTVENCTIHGDSKHRSGKCVKCSFAARKAQ